jgi:hypothetical protein
MLCNAMTTVDRCRWNRRTASGSAVEKIDSAKVRHMELDGRTAEVSSATTAKNCSRRSFIIGNNYNEGKLICIG